MGEHLMSNETFSPEDVKRLSDLEAAFGVAGGRGVDLANEIDALRRKRALLTEDFEEFPAGDEETLEDLVLSVSERKGSAVLNGGVSEMVGYLRADGWTDEQIPTGDEEDLQDAVLSVADRKGSAVLNGGLSSMVEYLREDGWTNEQILKSMGGA